MKEHFENIPEDLKYSDARWNEALEQIKEYEAKKRRKRFAGFSLLFAIAIGALGFWLNDSNLENEDLSKQKDIRKEATRKSVEEGEMIEPQDLKIDQLEKVEENGTPEYETAPKQEFSSTNSSKQLDSKTRNNTASSTKNSHTSAVLYANDNEEDSSDLSLNPSEGSTQSESTISFSLHSEEYKESVEKKDFVSVMKGEKTTEELEKFKTQKNFTLSSTAPIFYNPAFPNTLNPGPTKMEFDLENKPFIRPKNFVSIKFGQIYKGLENLQLTRHFNPYVGLYKQKIINEFQSIGIGLGYYQLNNFGITETSQIINYGLSYSETTYRIQTNKIHFLEIPFHFIHGLNPRLEFDAGINLSAVLLAESTLDVFEGNNFNESLINSSKEKGYTDGLNNFRVLGHAGLNYWISPKFKLDLSYQLSNLGLVKDSKEKSMFLITLNKRIK